MVSFDLMNIGVKGNSLLAHPLFLIECKHRCFCNWQVEDRTRQPASVGMDAPPWYGPRGIRLLHLDETPTFESIDHGYPIVPETDLAICLRFEKQVNVPLYEIDPHYDFDGCYGLDPGNKIECRGGELPNFPLPGPYTIFDFRNNQDLCAVANSGGNL